MSEACHWRETILLSLHHRNQKQCFALQDIISSYSILKDKFHAVTEENLKLNVELRRQFDGTGSVDTGKTYNREQIFKLQEEVTDLHRQKGVLAQQIIDLNKTIPEKDKLLQQRNSRIAELESTLSDQQAMTKQLLEKLKELETTNQTLLDEQHASGLALRAMDNKYKTSEDENTQFKQLISKLQSQVAEYQNAIFDRNFALQRDEIAKQLTEAAGTHVNVVERGSPMFCFAAAVPTKVKEKLEAHEGEVNYVKFSPSGRMFGSGGSDRRLKLYTIVNGKCEVKATLIGCNAGVTAIDFDPDESHCLGASNDFSCHVWTLSDFRPRTILTGHSNKVVAARFVGDAFRVVTGSSDRTLKLWDLRSRACIKTMLAMSACHDVVVCTPLNLMISGHFDKKLRMWDQRGELNTDQVCLNGRITGLDISTDMTYLLACTRDDALRTLDLRMNQVLTCFQADGFKVGLDCTRPCFSPDGLYVCGGGSDGGIYVWNTRTGRLETVLREHGSTAVCCSWNPMGTSLVSCERQKRVILWSDI